MTIFELAHGQSRFFNIKQTNNLGIIALRESLGKPETRGTRGRGGAAAPYIDKQAMNRRQPG